MSTETITIQHVSDFYKGIITLGDFYTVDDTPGKYLHQKWPEDTLVMDNGKKIALLGTADNDAIMLNPLADGNSDSLGKSWFVHYTNRVLSMRISEIIKYALNAVVESSAKDTSKSKKSKKAAEEEADTTPNWVWELAGKYAENITKATLDDYCDICKPNKNFFVIAYDKKERKTYINCNVINEKLRGPFPKVPAKHWEIYEYMFRRLLKVKTTIQDELVFTADKDCEFPLLAGYCSLLAIIYEAIKDPLETLGHPVTGLTDIQTHISFMTAYWDRVKGIRSQARSVPDQQRRGDTRTEREAASAPVRESGYRPVGASTETRRYTPVGGGYRSRYGDRYGDYDRGYDRYNDYDRGYDAGYRDDRGYYPRERYDELPTYRPSSVRKLNPVAGGMRFRPIGR